MERASADVCQRSLQRPPFAARVGAILLHTVQLENLHNQMISELSWHAVVHVVQSQVLN